jgi:hypothetical protein
MSVEAYSPLPAQLIDEIAQTLALNRAASDVSSAAERARKAVRQSLALPIQTFYRLTLAKGDQVIASDGIRRRSVPRELMGRFVVTHMPEFATPDQPYPDSLRFYPLRLLMRRFVPQVDEPRIAIGIPVDRLSDSVDFRLQRVSATEVYGTPGTRYAEIQDINIPSVFQ